jgi:hypothetical protein
MPASRHDSSGPRFEALRALIIQGSEADPLIGVKVGSEEGLEWLLNHLKTERGVHAETLMATAGALAGTSVQAAVWEEAGGLGSPGQAGLRRVRCHDGSSYWVGDPLNRGLVEGYGSPWHVLSETARQEGCHSLPSAEDLLLEGLQRLGTPAFGHPQVPVEHTPEVLDSSGREHLWRLMRPLCEACCEEPEEWPLLCGLLAARALRMVKSALAPDLAFRLAMDSAIDAARRPLVPPSMAA